MFWNNLDMIKDLDFIKEIKNKTNVKLIKAYLNYIFEDDSDYYELIRVFGDDYKFMDTLINYLTLIVVGNTPYYNQYIKEFAKKNYKIVLKDLEKLDYQVSVWQFIDIASKSKNNDLHLERLDLDRGLVNVYQIKEIYSIETVRVKLKEMIEKIKRVNLPKEVLNSDEFKEISNHLKKIVKFENVGGIKIKNYDGKEIPKEWHPPCIRGILEDILSGGSPSHYARRSFVVYWFCAKFNPNIRPIENGELLNISALEIGKSEENIENFLNEIVKMFNTVGDFNEDRTKYYISHNIGYRVADHITHCEYCKNWKDDGGKGLSYYCKPDDICKMKDKNGKPVIIHPLDYLCYNINKYVEKKNKKESNKNSRNNNKNNKI